MNDQISDSQTEPEPEADAPRWVKVFGYTALIIAVLMVVHLLIGGGAALHG